MGKQTRVKLIRSIKIDAAKCSGCRMCEAMCSASHADPKYSIINPHRSRIRVFWDEQNDLFVPVMAGAYTDVECNGRNVILINGKEYGECSFCRASCPSRDLFKEPGSNVPLKCDMCGEPPLPEPVCVKWCKPGALTYHQTAVEEEVKEEEEAEDVEEL